MRENLHMASNLKHLSHVQKVRILYKIILRLHRGLQIELKELGDRHVKSEFKRHKNCSINEAESFLTEWGKYAVTLAEQLDMKGKPGREIGNPLEKESLNNLRDDQIFQLYELMIAIKGKKLEK